MLSGCNLRYQAIKLKCLPYALRTFLPLLFHVLWKIRNSHWYFSGQWYNKQADYLINRLITQVFNGVLPLFPSRGLNTPDMARSI